MYTVYALSKLANITVRTLHYYDEIGLLKPSFVGKNGYRYYQDEELIKLQQILFFKELDFPLNNIKQIICSPNFNTLDALVEQKKMLTAKQNRLNKLINSITSTIMSMKKKKKLKGEELYDAFKDNDVKQYQQEAKDRWGNTEAYKQSMARVSKMTKEEMEKLKADGRAHTQKIADSMDLGPTHPEVQKLIKQAHEGVNFFYDCSTEMYRNLGKMYVEDPRFTAYYEKFRPGLAKFMNEAIQYYCDHAGA